LRVGRGDQAGVNVGPLIDDAAMHKVEQHVADALQKGARLRTGGKRHQVPGCADRFFQPTVLDRVSTDMLLCREETFGPVCPLIPFRSAPYGLAAYFYTRDSSRLMRVCEALECGIVGANDGLPATAQAPFGGVKHSGFGREGGRHGMAEYVDVKFVSWGL
jgi:succinate-semialdehyde dehydrogenase / glutarate-semialdehyde dehydrogenase